MTDEPIRAATQLINLLNEGSGGRRQCCIHKVIRAKDGASTSAVRPARWSFVRGTHRDPAAHSAKMRPITSAPAGRPDSPFAAIDGSRPRLPGCSDQIRASTKNECGRSHVHASAAAAASPSRPLGRSPAVATSCVVRREAAFWTLLAAAGCSARPRSYQIPRHRPSEGPGSRQVNVRGQCAGLARSMRASNPHLGDA